MPGLLRPHNGGLCLPCTQGRVRFVVGGGGFAPFVHDAVLQMEPGEDREVTIPAKDAFGECEWKPRGTAVMGGGGTQMRHRRAQPSALLCFLFFICLFCGLVPFFFNVHYNHYHRAYSFIRLGLYNNSAMTYWGWCFCCLLCFLLILVPPLPPPASGLSRFFSVFYFP